MEIVVPYFFMTHKNFTSYIQFQFQFKSPLNIQIQPTDNPFKSLTFVLYFELQTDFPFP